MAYNPSWHRRLINKEHIMALFAMPIADEDVPRVVTALCVNGGLEVTNENALLVVMEYINALVLKTETVIAQQEVVDALPDLLPVVFVDDTPAPEPFPIVDPPVQP
jgi:hypothetical protein